MTKKILPLTKYYGLLKTQAELDFVDIDLKNDTELFIDPWLMKDLKNDFGRACAGNLYSFFDEVLGNIRRGDEAQAMELLDNLHEVNCTHLGYSQQGMRGRAIADKHAGEIYHMIKESPAFKTGVLKDIEDTSLLVPYIGKDKISDIVTNVCMHMLVTYTNQQAKLHAIPQKPVGRWMIWNETTKKWTQGDPFELPFYSDKPILLVPKAVINTEMALNGSDFYNKYILPFEQERHLNNPSLGLCRMIKGVRKPPHKKDLRKVVPFTNKTIVKYVNEHPELLDEYKRDLGGKKTVKKQRKPRL